MPIAPSSPTPSRTLAIEIDRLLQKLPGSEPARAIPPDAVPVRRGPPTRRSSTVSAKRVDWLSPDQAALLGVWLRALTATGLGVAVAWWPYGRACGWMLSGYLAVIGVVLIAGGWASFSAWRERAATAHVLAHLVMFWGIVLAAEQVLPRIGYAGISATWICGG